MVVVVVVVVAAEPQYVCWHAFEICALVMHSTTRLSWNLKLFTLSIDRLAN